METMENLAPVVTPQQQRTTTPRPSSIATSVSISDRMSGGSPTPSAVSSSVAADRTSSAIGQMTTTTTPAPTTAIPTTTISTIAMQSGHTKIVIALLQSKEWIHLKVLNMDPHVTALGATLKEASDMLANHEDVLKKLQSKQSPVEELLRQADQLIATQKPRAEVYECMAQNLGLAWKDLNTQLEQRKTILKLNTSLHRQLDECCGKISAVENASFENPETVEACQELISRSKSLRKSMLTSFLSCLEEGQILIDKLEEQTTIDSRPDYGAVQAQYAISQVQRWLEKLHDRRNILEERFRTKQEKLLEHVKYLHMEGQMKRIREEVQEQHKLINDYGSDEPSVLKLSEKLSQRFLKIKELRDMGIQVARNVETTEFRHYQGFKLKNESFNIIDACNQIISHAEEMRNKLSLCLEFFQLVQEAHNKLDKVGVDKSASVNAITNKPLDKGQILLNNLGWDNVNARGVRAAYDKLLARKNQVVQAEELIYKTAVLNDFLQDFNDLYSYLIDVDSFLKSEQHLGPDVSSSEELRDILRSKLCDIESKQVVFDLDEEIKSDDLDEKVSTLNNFMKDLIETAERLLALTEFFIEILHQTQLFEQKLANQTTTTTIASVSSSSKDKKYSTNGLPSTPTRLGENSSHALEDTLMKLEDLAAGFLEACSDAAKRDSAFRTEQACLKIKEILDNIHTRLDKAAEVKKQKDAAEEMSRHIAKTLESVAALIKSSYPILPERQPEPPSPSSSSSSAGGGAAAATRLRRQYKDGEDPIHVHLESALNQVSAQVEQLENEFDVLLGQEPGNAVLKSGQNQVKAFAVNYKWLILNLTTLYKNLCEVDVLIDESPMVTENSSAYEEVDEIFKICRDHANEIVLNIREMEPEDSGKVDEARLLAAIEEKRLEWDEAMRRKAKAIAARDLQQIEKQLGDLRKHIEMTRGQYGESLMAARECSTSFATFEETIEILGGKIQKFVENVVEDMKPKAAALKENWTSFLQMVEERRRLINLTVMYFTLVNEAEAWFKDGSKLLITIARKSTTIKTPEEADQLLDCLASFVKPGEVEQDKRIAKISQLASQLYGEEKRKLYNSLMIKENREIIDSLNTMNGELTILADNLRLKRTAVKAAAATEAAAAEKEEEEVPAPPPPALEVPGVGTSTVEFSVTSPTSPLQEPLSTSSTTNSLTETVVTNSLSTIETSIFRPLTPTMLEKETQFEIMPCDSTGSIITKGERDTVTQTIDEKQFEKETQTDIMKPLSVPLSFTSPLQDISVTEGEKLRFQCIVTGYPEPDASKIVWLKDGLLIASSNLDYKTEFKNGICSLTIDETMADDSSIFTCKASNNLSSCETSARLTVKESQDNMLSPPKFEMPLPPSTKLIEGTVNHQLSCLVKGSPLPTVEWFKNNVNIDTSSEFIITFNNGLCILKFGEILLEDEGIYHVTATNKAGEARTECNILVEARNIVFLEPLSKKTMARTGQKLKLECRTNTSCEFQWFHDGKPVKDNIKSEATSSILTVPEAYSSDSGHYVVVARNPRLGENKCGCHVVVKGRLPNETSDSEVHSDMEPIKPKLKMCLEDKEVREGEKVRLDCVISAIPEPEVIWYHNGKPVKESQDFKLIFHGDKCSLIIENVFAEDAGEYRITACNNAGEISSKCKLTVTGLEETNREIGVQSSDVCIPTKFSKLIEDTMVNENEEVSFKCSISEGNSPVRWYKNAVEITNNPGYVISSSGNDHELKILRATKEHRGNYMVKAGTAKCFACLIVKSPLDSSPSLVQKTDEQIVSSTSISTHTSIISKQQLSMQQQQTMTSNEPNQQLESVSVSDRAAFFKSKESPSKSTMPSVPLIIKPRNNIAPKFISPLNGIMCDEGNFVVLEGQIDAYPDPTIKWTKNDLDFDFEPFSKFAHGKVTFELRDIQIKDGGRYSCIVENPAGIATSVADVVVRKTTFPPVFGKRLQAQTMKQNKRIYMEVEVIGTPAPVITWYKDGALLDTKNSDYQFRTEGNRHIMIVPNATSSKSGQYMVLAQNEAGNAQSIADVVVLGDQQSRRSPICGSDFGGGITIFESTVGISEELGVPKPITLIYEMQTSSSSVGSSTTETKSSSHQQFNNKSQKALPKPPSSPTPQSIPIILKTQPTLPSTESFESDPSTIPRPVLESPRLVSPLGKPLHPTAVKVESITVTAEPLKGGGQKTTTSTTTTQEISTATTSAKKFHAQEITSKVHNEKSTTSIFKQSVEKTTPTSSVCSSSAESVIEISIPIMKQVGEDKKKSLITTTTPPPSKIVPPPPPPPINTTTTASTSSTSSSSATSQIPRLPESILKFMESTAVPSTTVTSTPKPELLQQNSNRVKNFVETFQQAESDSSKIIGGDGKIAAKFPTPPPPPQPQPTTDKYYTTLSSCPSVPTTIGFTTSLPSIPDETPPPISSSSGLGGGPPLFYEATRTVTKSSETMFSSSSESKTMAFLPELIPGPPPQICFTPKPPESETLLKKSMVSEKVKNFEQVQRKLSVPDLPGAVRILPPEPSPPVTTNSTMTPNLSRKCPFVTSQTCPESTTTAFVSSTAAQVDSIKEFMTQLEPFPFKPPEEEQPQQQSVKRQQDVVGSPSRVKPQPPPKPKKFVPGEFRESDYESDLEGKIPPKWQPSSAFVTVTSSSSASAVPPPVISSGGIVMPPPPPPLATSTAPVPAPAEVEGSEFPPRESVKNLIKSWPPSENTGLSSAETTEIIEHHHHQEMSTTSSTEEVRRRSIKDDVNFFEAKGAGHSRLSPIVTQGKLTPSTDAVTMDKIWSRQAPKSKIWPPSTTTSATTTSTTSSVPQQQQQQQPPPPPAEPINYYISTVSTPRSTPVHEIYEQTTTTMTHEISSYSHEQTLQVSSSVATDELDRTCSPTVNTDKGIKPSDAKKGIWPPAFAPPNNSSSSQSPSSSPFKPVQPGWMQPKVKPTTTAGTGPTAPMMTTTSSEPPILLKPGTPPEIGFAPIPSSQAVSQSMSSAYESKNAKKTRQEGGYPGNTLHLNHTGTIFHIMEDYNFEPPPQTSQSGIQPSVPTQSQFHEYHDSHPEASGGEAAGQFYDGPYSNMTSQSNMEQAAATHHHHHFESRTSSSSRTVRKIPRIIPSKFVKGDFYESDYASDVEDTRIKPKWVPYDSDTDSEPTYRPVRPQLQSWRQPSRPASDALKCLDEMGQEFAQKAESAAEKFSSDLVSNLPSSQTAYRQEDRNIQSGGNQDIVYFKYDFGYEVGLLVPREGGPTENKPTEEGIKLPILHETTANK